MTREATPFARARGGRCRQPFAQAPVAPVAAQNTTHGAGTASKALEWAMQRRNFQVERHVKFWVEDGGGGGRGSGDRRCRQPSQAGSEPGRWDGMGCVCAHVSSRILLPFSQRGMTARARSSAVAPGQSWEFFSGGGITLFNRAPSTRGRYFLRCPARRRPPGATSRPSDSSMTRPCHWKVRSSVETTAR